MSNRPYIVQLSNKTDVQIDSDELEKITEGIRTASPIRLKKGIINPSFIIAVIPDRKRWEDHMSMIPGIQGSEEWEAERSNRRAKGCTPLHDIFCDTPLALKQGTQILIDMETKI